MATHDIDTVLGWRGSTVVDRDGEKIGTFEEVYLDQDDHPAWGAVRTGLFGMRQTFVPLAEASPVDGGLQVPFDKDHVKDAPSIDPDTQLSDEEEDRLHRHYGLSPGAGDEVSPGAGDEAPAAPAGERAAQAEAHADRERAEDGERAEEREVGDAAAGGPGDGAEMIRSEEELVVGTRKRVRGKARLKKYVVTEHVQRTVPVQREEVRVEYDPPEAGEGAPEESQTADTATEEPRA